MGRLGSSTQSGTGGRLKKSTGVATSTPATSPKPSPTYFYSKTDSRGGAIGYSQNEFDSSGRPFFAYRNPNDTSTTTDRTRVATVIDPRVATSTPRTNFSNPRESNLRDDYMNIKDNEELDHRMALALAGSNDVSNLKPIPSAQNQAYAPTEGRLSSDVSKGRLPLFNAQIEEAKAKKLTPPWTPEGTVPPKVPTRIANTPTGPMIEGGFAANPVGITLNTIAGIPAATLQVAKDIGQSIARTAVGFGGDVRNIFRSEKDRVYEYQPQGRLMRSLLGKGPVTTLAKGVADNEQGIRDSSLADKIGINDRAALPLAFAGTLGSAALDLTPFGASRKKALEVLAKETDINIIKNILKQDLKLTDNIIEKSAPFVAKATTPQGVERILTNVAKGVVEGDPRQTLKNVEKRVGVNRAEYDEGYFNRKPEVLPKALEERKIALEIEKEAVKESPLNSLTKYQSKGRLGELPEVTGSGKGKFARAGDTIIDDTMGYKENYKSANDTEDVRESFAKFTERKGRIKAEEVALKSDIKQFKQTKLSSEGLPLALSKKQKGIASQSHPLPDYKGGTGEVRSVEKALQASLAGVPTQSGIKRPSLTEIVTQTPLKNKVGIVDYIRTPENVLKKMGLEKEGKLVRDQYEKYVKELPVNIEKITKWSKRVPKESNTRIFRYLDGENIDLTLPEKQVTFEIKGWLKQWADRLGLPQDKRVTEYITHLFDDQLVKKEFDEDLAKIIADKIPSQVYDPFLQSRLGAKGYKQDTWAALDAYVKRATRKVHMDPALSRLEEVGSKMEQSQWDYLKSYADRINMRPTKADTRIDNALKQSPLGYKLGQRPLAAISRTLRQWTFRGMLGANVGSALRNLSQGVNTYAKLGEKYTAIGYMNLMRNGTKELKEVGVLADNFVQDRTLNATKKAIEKLDKGLFFFFDTAEKINRGAAYFGAKAKALKAGKSEQEAIDFAKKIVRDTQFNYGSIDTPLGLNSDIAKVLTQFLTYPVKQTEFLAGMAKNKEYMGIARYVIGGLAFVYSVGHIMGMEPDEIVPWMSYITGESKFGVPPSLKVPASIVGAIADAPDKYGNKRDISTKLRDIGKESVGIIPAGVQIKKSIQGAQLINQGESRDKTGRIQFKQDPSLAAKAQSVIFGKYSGKNAQNYFDKKPSTEETDIQKTYDKVQSLMDSGSRYEAQRIIDGLTDDEYEEYKKVRSSNKRNATLDAKKKMRPTAIKVRDLMQSGDKAGAQKIVDGFDDEEYRIYKLVKDEI